MDAEKEWVKVTNELTGTSFRVRVFTTLEFFGKILLLANGRWVYEDEAEYVEGPYE